MYYAVPLIAQPTGCSCWAASMAMVLSWSTDSCVDPGSIAANNGGPSYMPQFSNGLGANDRYILTRNGFTLDAPRCYTLPLVQQLLEDKGPLWVASAAPAPHIRVVTGYFGQMLSINDPLPVAQGSRYVSSFGDFFGAMEQLGASELKAKAPVYVAWVGN